jgi:branched-subunit amino acid aminotransferase/4-amino-4-deoxychorismate lyase
MNLRTPAAYLQGKLIPADALAVPVYDAGFVQGTTVAEQLRTFGGQLFRLEAHLDRFERSLEIAGVHLPFSREQLAAMADDLAARNHPLLAAGDDLGLCLFATPGPYAAMAPAAAGGPLVALHTYPLPFSLFAEKYTAGESLVAPQVPQIAANVLPRELKCRSRMHYFLADQQARQADPRARALLLDEDGCVLEATTANVLIVRDGELVSPPRKRILHGISLETTCELAQQEGIHCEERELRIDDVLAADEVLLTSTSTCILPVLRVNGRPIGGGVIGPVYRQLLAAWCDLTKVDIALQAARWRNRTVA